ncbi:MAG TPA: hypothetical protein VK666_19045, partial [Chryseolinea sp.]|nr:hypothetical protein [Chryseolinea sp.]
IANGQIGMSQASTSTNGYLSSADWNSFNTKLGSIDTTNIAAFYTKVRGEFTGLGPISIANGQIGMTQASTSTNGYLSSADWNSFNTKLGSIDTTNISTFYLKVRNEFTGSAPITITNGVIAMPKATAAVNGYLSSGDWTLFNNKLSGIDTTNIATFFTKVRAEFTGLGPISITNGQIGMTQANASTNGYLSSADWNSFNTKLGSIDTTNIANFFTKVRGEFTGSAPITITNGVIAMPKATSAVNGYLSSGDWTTFNNKLSTIDTTNISNFYLKVRNEMRAGQGITYDSLTGLISATSNWLMTGNSGISASNYLGTNDDKAMVLKSNNTSFLEFGRRQTLGLTQAYPDYTDDNESVTYVRSALQFEAPNANFYKPKMFTDVNGNFRIKGSSAGTDLFEMGSTGTANNGGFEFIIGDDGDEPIVFKSYNFSTGMTEMMRLQSGRMGLGSNSFDATNPEKLLVDAGVTSSINLMTGKGSIDNYLQINVKNLSAGTSASSDVVATSNNGNESVNYIDMGINGGGFSNTIYPILNGANLAYIYGTGNDMVIGNATAAKNLRFFTGGMATTNEAMRIDGTGKVGIATLTPTAKLDVGGTYKLGTAGTVLTNMIKTSASFTNTNSFSYGSTELATATVTGATTNATVIVNPRTALPAGFAIAYVRVSAANTVQIAFINNDTVASAVGTIVFDITVIQ